MNKLTLSLTVLALAGCAGSIRLPGLSLGTSSPSSAGGGDSKPVFVSPAAQEATRQWDAASRKYGDQLDDLYWFANNLPSGPASQGAQHADGAMRMLKDDKLGEVAKQCAAGAFKGERNGTIIGKEYFRADTLCPLAVNRTEVLKKALRQWALADLAARLDEQRRHVEDMAKSGRVSVSWVVDGQTADELKAYVSSFDKKYFEALGEPIPAEALAPADQIVQQRQKTVLELALKGKIDRTAKADPGAEKAIRDEYAGSVKGIQIKAVIMKDADWRLVKNEYGVLLRHYKNADVLVKAKDGSFCALVPASVGQPYEDNGRYAPQYGVDEFLEGFPVKCP